MFKSTVTTRGGYNYNHSNIIEVNNYWFSLSFSLPLSPSFPPSLSCEPYFN